MGKRLFLSIIMLHAIQVNSQQLTLMVTKGSVLADNEKIEPGSPYIIKKEQGFQFEKGACAVILNTFDKSFNEICAAEKRVLKYNDLSKKEGKLLQNKSKPPGTGKSSGFWAYISDHHDYRNQKKNSYGKVKGSVRGLNQKNRVLSPDNPYFPADSVIYISDTIRIAWDNKEISKGDELIVTNAESGETVFRKSISSAGSVNVPVNTAGSYRWRIYSPAEDKVFVQRIFTVPDVQVKKRISDDIQLFKNEIDGLNNETQELLLDYYLSQNNIVTE